MSRKIQISMQDGETIKIKRATCDSNFFDVSRVLSDSGQVIEIEVKFRPKGAPIGMICGEISLFTDHPKMSVIHIPMNALIVGEVVITPEVILLTADSSVSRRVIIVAPGRSKNFSIKEVTLLGKKLAVSISSLGPAWRIVLPELLTSFELESAKIIINTDSDSAPQIQVPIKIVKNDSARQPE